MGSCIDDIRPLVRRLGKPPAAWQRQDLVEFCVQNEVRVVNFRYPALDGKLKVLRLPVNNRPYLERILATGERVDGSSLFPGIFKAGNSDLYVIPVYRWAFLNPFAEDELDIVCRFADRDGRPCLLTPDNMLAAGAQALRARHGLELTALTELEFYIFTEGSDKFTSKAQRNYHQSAPYLQGAFVADDILRTVGAVTGGVKYCHAEVGYLDRIASNMPEINGRRVEQYELEFDLMPIEDLGCWTTVARWLIRRIADFHDASVTFVPKLDEGIAGNGMHIHLALERDGRNVMMTDDGDLTDEARAVIGGLMDHAKPLTGFGNTVAASYLRLVPGQEAPTRICWGARNRSVLVRVPLGFHTQERPDQIMNPDEASAYPDNPGRPTIEYRSPDGSAQPYLLLAAIALCVEDGLSSKDARSLANRLELTGDASEATAFEVLPQTAVAAAEALETKRGFFEAHGIAPQIIDIMIEKLRLESDTGLAERLRRLPAAERLAESRRIMHKDLHKH